MENSSPHLIYKEKAAGSANKVPEGITCAPGLVFYQKDIHEFLRTKAAAYTMMAVLMEQTGITAEDISDYYMAGAFGAHINKHSAVSIGMYPDVTYDRIHTVGNTSLKGARMFALVALCWMTAYYPGENGICSVGKRREFSGDYGGSFLSAAY